MKNLRKFLISCLTLFFALFVGRHFFIPPHQDTKPIKLNIIGFFDDIKSVARHTSSFVECLYPEVPLKIFKSRLCELRSYPPHFNTLIDESIDLTDTAGLPAAIRKNGAISGMTIYTHGDDQWGSWENYVNFPNKSIIKFAYDVHESSLVPEFRIQKINNNFDALIVPDQWLVNVYKDSGVKRPIFVLPQVVNVPALSNQPLKTAPHNPFVF